jgi:hypothetical protein
VTEVLIVLQLHPPSSSSDQPFYESTVVSEVEDLFELLSELAHNATPAES